MKKAIKILSIIDVVLTICSILTTFVFFFIFIVALNSSDIIADVARQSNATEESIKLMLTGYTVGCLIATIWQIPGLVFDFILLNHASSEKTYSQASWIVYGALSIAFADTVVGILAIVYAVMQGEHKNDDNVQEVHFEEK